jgi:nitrite reductase/ring-hydroxylating ferredoxin subunit
MLEPEGKLEPGYCGGWSPGMIVGGSAAGLDDGNWGVDLNVDDFDTELVRQNFLFRNYAVAYRKVCDWFVYDGSCYSGKTPMVFDQLENSAGPHCSSREEIYCPLHAGWEFDVAGGISWSDVTGHNGDACNAAANFKDIFQRTAKKRAEWIADGGQYSYQPLMIVLSDLLESNSKTWVWPGSFYADKGYHDDQPPPAHHANKGYR